MECMENRKRKHEGWRQTLDAMESAARGNVVDASEVHDWLNSWGTENEREAPCYGKPASRLST